MVFTGNVCLAWQASRGAYNGPAGKKGLVECGTLNAEYAKGAMLKARCQYPALSIQYSAFSIEHSAFSIEHSALSCNMKWTILSSEYLFNDLWFRVRKDVCKTPQGKIVDPYYVYEFPEWVTAVPITEDGKVIMVRQYRHAIGETCIEFPGGCVDETDIDFGEAIKRELLEETGYSFSAYKSLGNISANPSTNNNLMHMFLATGGRKVAEQTLDHNEEIEVVLLTVDEVKQLVKENKILQSMHVACFLYAMQELGELKNL